MERSGRIERSTRSDFSRKGEVIKLLLLGAGESGKSTFFKQFTFLYGKGYSEEERQGFVEIVNNNIFIGLKILIKQSEKLKNNGVLEAAIAPNLKDIVNNTMAIEYHSSIDVKLACLLKQLWIDPGISKTWQFRSSFYIPYDMEYFMGRIDAISAKDYVPTQEDIVRARVRTTGIVETSFVYERSHFQILDVGGQRNERSKWMHCFDGITAILFVVAISEYDQVLYEDSKTNRVNEAMALFDEICNAEWSKGNNVILFLNKTDIFAKKIEENPLGVCFPEYSGPQEFEQCSKFMMDTFSALNRSQKYISMHLTCAIDTDNVRKVFESVRDIILRKELSRAELL